MAAPPPPPNQACSPQVAAPVLTGGSLYAVANGFVTKYNPATGRVIWRHPPASGSQVYVSLAVARGVVVVGSVDCVSQSDPEGQIHTFSASTGAPGWSGLLPGGAPLSHLVVSGGFVVAAGNSAGAGDVVAVQKLATGALVWFRGTSQCPSFLGAVVVVAQLVVSYSCNAAGAQSLVASHLGTGVQVWSRGGGNWQLQRGGTDTTASRHLYVVSPDGTAAALDPRTGKTLYALAGASQVLAVDGTRAYAQCGGGAGVCAYNTTSGRLRWTARTPVPAALAAEAGGVVYLDQGMALNSGTGQMITQLWSAGLLQGPLPATALAVGDGRIAAVTDPRALDLYGLPGS